MIDRERARLNDLGFALEVNGEVVEFLIRRGFHKTLGARPMRSTVERHLQDAIAEGLLSRCSGSGRVEVDLRNESLVLRTEQS
jgi:ATP-dependent Clp protease ATP-binding subunit ClpB